MLITLHNDRPPRSIFIPICAGCAQLLQSKSLWLVGRMQQLPAASRIVVAHVERAFAAFAAVPYYDARTQRELDRMFQELERPTGQEFG